MSKTKCWSFLAMAAGLVLAASCGGGGGSSPTAPTTPMAKTVTVTIGDDFTFSPKNVQINAGDTVRWMYNGSLKVHTVTAIDGSFDSGFIFTAPGTSYQQTFNTAGVTVNYQCKTHYAQYGMAGAIQVGSSAPPVHPGY